MRNSRVLFLVLALLMMVVMFVACNADAPTSDDQEQQEVQGSGSEQVSDTDQKDPYVIGVDLFYKSDEYYLDIEVCMKKAAEELGIDLDIQNADTDLSNQIQQVEDFIAKGVDAILISAVDPVGSYACVEAANAAGIPIFMFDGVTENKEGITAYSIGDFYGEGVKGGEWAKAYIEENLDGKAKFAVLDYFPSAVICGGRANGFIDTLEAMEGVELVAHQDGSATRDGGMSTMETILTDNQNDVDVVFAINYESGAGAAAAIEAVDADTIVVAIAWNAEGYESMENGNSRIMKSFVIPASPLETAKMVNVVADYLNGKDIEKEVFMDCYVYDETNVAESGWRDIVASREE